MPKSNLMTLTVVIDIKANNIIYTKKESVETADSIDDYIKNLYLASGIDLDEYLRQNNNFTNIYDIIESFDNPPYIAQTISIDKDTGEISYQI